MHANAVQKKMHNTQKNCFIHIDLINTQTESIENLTVGTYTTIALLVTSSSLYYCRMWCEFSL